jgi:hypothetical protein
MTIVVLRQCGLPVVSKVRKGFYLLEALFTFGFYLHVCQFPQSGLLVSLNLFNACILFFAFSFEDILDMFFHRLFADKQFICILFVGATNAINFVISFSLLVNIPCTFIKTTLYISALKLFSTGWIIYSHL